MEDSTNAARLIPAFNADAKNPEDIYPLHNIIPKLEWAAMEAFFISSKIRQMAAQSCMCYPTLVVIGYDNTSYALIPHPS